MTKKEILQKKEKAAAYFTQKLLQSKAGKDIARVVLFGSVAEGEADDYSDIDILVFGRNINRTENEVWEAALSSYEKFEEGVEPLVYPVRKLKNPDSYFLYQSIKTGRQLYP